MITLENVSKRYVTDHVPGGWVLKNVSLTIPPRARVGVVGTKGSGKSTFLRLIAGSEMPTEGKIERDARIATPTSYARSFQPLLTGRQNAKFTCRINGNVDDLEDRLSVIEELAGLGNKFEKPVNTYTPVMKSSLSFALSVALDFDMYLADGFNFSGPTAFKNIEAAEAALEKMLMPAGIVMVAKKGVQGDAMLKRFCTAGVWLHDGRADWFDDINDAINANRASQPAAVAKSAAQQPAEITEQAKKVLDRINKLRNSLKVLSSGLMGNPPTVAMKDSMRLVRAARRIDMNLLTREEILERGYGILDDAVPVLKRRLAASGEGEIENLYDLESQCQKLEEE